MDWSGRIGWATFATSMFRVCPLDVQVLSVDVTAAVWMVAIRRYDPLLLRHPYHPSSPGGKGSRLEYFGRQELQSLRALEHLGTLLRL